MQLCEPIARSLPLREHEGTSSGLRLYASDAWIVCSLGRRALLLEPGPALLTFNELELEPDEVVVDLRARGDGGSSWQLLTGRRLLELNPAHETWETVETLPGELLWQRRDLWAFLTLQGGTELRSGLSGPPLLSVPEPLSAPAWTADGRFFCHSQATVYYGAEGKDEPPTALAAPEPLAAYPSIFEDFTGRLYIPGQRTLFWWEPGGGRFVPFVPSGGGAVLPAPGGMVVLESDRLRFFGSGARPVWDSRATMPSFARTAQHWDHAGDALLVPRAVRGPGTQLFLADLAHPGRSWSSEIEKELLSEPRLAPGGIAAAQRGADGSAELVWIGLEAHQESFR